MAHRQRGRHLVSVTEIAPRGEEFERTPPHDLAAEQCVLGGMLLSKDAISDVLEVIRPSDHYRPAHQLVHEVILDLYGRGEPADAVTVAAELTKRGDIARVGGAPYLHTLIASVPTAANAGYYARIVRERAILRRLVEVGTRIVQLGYAGDGDADELVDRAEAEIYGVTERRVSDDYLPLSEIMPGALDEIEAIGSRGGGLTGVPTGFADLDALTNGLHPGQMIVIAARPALGKALALDTPLPTPAGWTTMGEVRVGDQLIGANGAPVRVLAATQVMHGRPCYEVEFSGGEIIVADGEHQWLTWTRSAVRTGAPGDGTGWPGDGGGRGPALMRRPQVVTTAELATVRRAEEGTPGHAVLTPGPLDLPEAELPVLPYALGAWLADGLPSGTGSGAADPEIAMLAEASGVLCDRQGPIQRGLASLGVLGDRHIPDCYLRSSQAQRRALLAGLLDVGGTVLRSGSVELALGGTRLAADARELIHSLGYLCSLTADGAPGGSVSAPEGSVPLPRAAAPAPARFLAGFSTDDQVFWLSSKQRLHKERSRHDPQSARWRDIVAVRPVPTRPVRCVQVSGPDHLYLAGRQLVPTHNSTLALDLARACSIKHGLTAAIFSLEMSRNEITMRLLSAEARVPLHSMRTGQLGDEDWTRLARRMSEVVDAPLFIDDSPNMSMMEIRAKCRRMKQRNDLRLVIIDYLQLMSSPKRVENRQQEVSDMSRSLKLLAKELEVPVIAVAQLNRGPEQRTDKRPLLADLRESGCLTAETRILRADTGAEVTIGELMASGERDVPVWSLDERLRMAPRIMTHAFASGIKEVFQVRLRSGREVQATANHPFLTYDGWRPLGGLVPGSRVAVPRGVPSPTVTAPLPEPEIVLLAHLLGDGSFVRNQPLRYASIDEANLAVVAAAATQPSPHRLTHGRRNPVAAWLDSLGLFGLRSHEKFVPARYFSLPNQQVALFLRHLWATDGCVWWDTKPGQARIYYASTSRRLVDDVAQLLLRFNVMTRVKETRKSGYRPCFQLHINGSENQLRFLDSIGVHGNRSIAAGVCAEMLRPIQGNVNLDTVPREVWTRVRAVLQERQMSQRQFAAAVSTQFCGSTMWKRAPSRPRLARVASILDDADLEMVATNDVFWDEIASVVSIGEQCVYDATVPGTSNFIANGIALHNSIEQDSDVVILLHREDAYERESPRAGEADFIVAKHRNGPTATVTVAFQGHYSRFVDMAPL
jgi:replicative DNA helicase